MKSFKDSAGREWNIVINVGQISRLRDRLNIDLAKLYESEARLYTEVVLDPVAFVNLLFVICEKQAAEKQVTDVQFGEGFDGDTYELAMEAFEEEMLLFFPKRQRETLTRAKTKGEEIRTKAIEIAHTRLNNLNVTEAAERMLSGSLTN